MEQILLNRRVLIEKHPQILPITKDDFQKYLKSIGGLISGYKPNSEPIVSPHYFSVGEGWYGLLKNLIQEAIDSGWNKQVLQVKEKFGGLSFYTNSCSDEVHEIISKYSSLSITVCEVCGKPGKIRGGTWISTLCDEHVD